MPSDRSRQHETFEVASNVKQVLRRDCVIDLVHCLFNYGTFIQLPRHIVRGCANQLETSRVSRVTSLRTFESGQKRLMSAYRSPLEVSTGVLGKYLSVARQNEQFGVKIFEKRNDSPLLLLLAPSNERVMVERDPMRVRQAARGLMIRNDRRHINRQRTGAASMQ